MGGRKGHWLRRAAPWARGLVLALACFTWPSSASAYTWMMKHGYTACSVCHADPSGGELLTPYGRVTADLLLRMQYGQRAEGAAPPKPGVLWGAWEPPEELLISGAYRNLYVVRPDQPGDEFTFVPVMQGDLYGQVRFGWFRAGGSIGVGRTREGSDNGRAAQVTTNQEGYNLLSRTHYVGVDFNDELLLRAGRLNLPFGLRIPEHTAWVREATRTDRESDQQHGLALSYVGDKLRGEAMAILGNYQLGPDEYRERGYALFVEGFAGTLFAAGLSSKLTYAETDRLTAEVDTVRQAHGLTMRWMPLNSLAFLIEGDALFRSAADPGYVGFIQADYELITGLHLLLTGEILDQGQALDDRNGATPGLGEPRFGGWFGADWFFYKQLEFRTDVVLRQEDPFTLLGQLHFYL
jgi:hypothetical protein